MTYEQAAADPSIPVISKDDYIEWLEARIEAVRSKCQDLKRAPERSADSEWERGISTGAALVLDVLDGERAKS